MKRLITYSLLLITLLSASAQVPFVWEADTSAAKPASKDLYRGETLLLRPLYLDHGAPAHTNGMTFTLFWQTNGMGSAWWSDPTNAFLWSPDRDTGADRYTLFIRAQSPGGTSYRANALLRMLPSPGFSPADAPPPSYYPTLAADLAPYLLSQIPPYDPPGSAAAVQSNLTAEVQARIQADNLLQQQITALAECASLTGSVSAASADTALRLASPDTNWWISVDSGTATLYHVTHTADLILSGSNLESGLVESNPWTLRPEPYNGRGVWVGTLESVFWVSADNRWVLSGMPEAPYHSVLYAIEADQPVGLWTAVLGEGTLTTAWGNPAAATNAVGTYVTASDLAAALQSFNPAAATNALAVASNAFILASAAATQSQLASATNHIVQTYLVASNAWLAVDFSNQVLSVSILSTNNLTNTVSVSAAAGIDPQATNLLWLALSAGLATKAPKAWGTYAPDGSPNPDPAYMTWLNAPATFFASGMSWSTYGSYAVLTATGTVAYASGADGSARIGPDGTNYFGFAVGGNITVGAVPDSIYVYGGGEPGGYAEITYPYTGGDYPVLWFAPGLQYPFSVLTEVIWVDNLDGSATVTAPAESGGGFYKASTTINIGAVFESTMPARLLGGVIGSTNTTPVVYDSVITVTSGGKNYRIPAQEVP